MSQENVDILRRAYEALNRGDYASAFATFDPDIEWQLPEGGMNTGLLVGHAQIREVLDGYLEVFEVYRMEPEAFFEGGDHVVVFVRTVARGRGSGVGLDFPFAHVWTLTGGKAVRCQTFPDRDQALEAAGLSE